MSGYDEALGRRAVACKAWKWLSGMLAVRQAWPARLTLFTRVDEAFLEVARGLQAGTYDPTLWPYEHEPYRGENLPDFADAATRGCLLDLVRKAWNDPDAHLVRYETWVKGADGNLSEREWWWALAQGHTNMPRIVPSKDGGNRYLAGPTEAEALVAALEAAPS